MSVVGLVLADVDGTLVTPERRPTEPSRRSVLALRAKGAAFVVTSGRHRRSMSPFIAPLDLTMPIAAFNGGTLLRSDLSRLEERTLPNKIVGQLVKAIERHNLEVWLYHGANWLMRRLEAPHVDGDQRTVRFAPATMPSFHDLHQRIVRIVGARDDMQELAHCETDVRQQFAEHISMARHRPYPLHVTDSSDQGTVVRRMSEMLKVSPEQLKTIDDGPNDVLMFEWSGLAIAMGDASHEVHHAAHPVPGSHGKDSFAEAVEKYFLADHGEPQEHDRSRTPTDREQWKW